MPEVAAAEAEGSVGDGFRGVLFKDRDFLKQEGHRLYWWQVLTATMELSHQGGFGGLNGGSSFIMVRIECRLLVSICIVYRQGGEKDEES